MLLSKESEEIPKSLHIQCPTSCQHILPSVVWTVNITASALAVHISITLFLWDLIHSFKKYLLSTYYVPDPILKKVGMAGIRQSWFPGIYILGGKVKLKMLVAQSCPTLCKPMDGRPPGSSVHGILQARMLEWRLTINKCKFTPIIPQVKRTLSCPWSVPWQMVRWGPLVKSGTM